MKSIRLRLLREITICHTITLVCINQSANLSQLISNSCRNGINIAYCGDSQMIRMDIMNDFDVEAKFWWCWCCCYYCLCYFQFICSSQRYKPLHSKKKKLKKCIEIGLIRIEIHQILFRDIPNVSKKNEKKKTTTRKGILVLKSDFLIFFFLFEICRYICTLIGFMFAGNALQNKSLIKRALLLLFKCSMFNESFVFVMEIKNPPTHTDAHENPWFYFRIKKKKFSLKS